MFRRRALQSAVATIKSVLSSATATAAAPKTPPQQSKFLQQQTRNRWTPGNDGYTRFNSYIREYQDPRYASYQQLRRRRQMTTAAFLGAGGSYIWYTSREEIPYTGRKHAILVNIQTERELGAQTFQQVIMEAKMKRTLLPANHPAAKAVRRVGMRIAQVASDGAGGGFQSHMKGLNWEFAVIHSPEVNAFVVPGGKVVVYTGLLRLLKTEDELAAVIAHEAGHVVARHVAERLTQGSVMELGRFIAYWAFGLPIPAAPLAAIFFLPNSRKAETEADIIGIQLAARACYDPAAAAVVFDKLGAEEAKHGGNAIPNILRTHPVSSERIRKIKQMLPKAEALKEAAGCNTSWLDAFTPRTSVGLGSGGGGGGIRQADWGIRNM